MSEKGKFKVQGYAEPMWGAQIPLQKDLKLHTHGIEKCEGRSCVVHNPSDHHMRSWDLNWRGDTQVMERICPDHGTGHPDPDSMAYERTIENGWKGVHGCCINEETGRGCCGPPE